jgi:hypothetical protein
MMVVSKESKTSVLETNVAICGENLWEVHYQQSKRDIMTI